MKNKNSKKSKKSRKSRKYTNKKGGWGNFSRNCGENKIECGADTINFGLCVDNHRPELCNSLDYDISNPDIISLSSLQVDDVVEYNQNVIRGKEKRYSPDHFIEPCINKEGDNERVTVIDNTTGENVPQNFSIVTMNALGIYMEKPPDPSEIDGAGNYHGNNPKLLIMSLRAKMMRDYLKAEQPDIVCFQEMSLFYFNFLYKDGLEQIYPHYYEKDLPESMMKRDIYKQKDVDVFILSKFKPKKLSFYALKGNLDYTDSLGVFEFNNLVIIDVYLQAGSKASPGQKYFWKDYSRCRSQQISFIQNLISKIENIREKGLIVLGDFNFDLNSVETEDSKNWPESFILQGLRLLDSWVAINGPDGKQKGNEIWKSGLTENTDKNTLRYNSKLEEKMFRYDGIFNNEKLRPTHSMVILDNPLALTSGNETRAYEETIIPNTIKKIPELLARVRKNSSGTYDLFASDHFGVSSHFSFNSSGGKKNRKTKKYRRNYRNSRKSRK
jgi:hypothetical protein